MIEQIKLTADRKTAFYTDQPNTFGLMPGPGFTCPGATCGKGGCREVRQGRTLPTCYVERLFAAYGGIKKVLIHNTDLLQKANLGQKTTLLLDSFQRFKLTTYRHNAKSSHKVGLAFRIHWAGDLFNEEYAIALREAIIQTPDVRFWMYTRSFTAAQALRHGLSGHGALPINLAVYLSVDEINMHAGLQMLVHYPEMRLAYMSDTPNGLERYGFKYTPCPVDNGSLPLEGACQKCRLCIHGTSHVWFKTR